jgi:hypothetical protein
MGCADEAGDEAADEALDNEQPASVPLFEGQVQLHRRAAISLPQAFAAGSGS